MTRPAAEDFEALGWEFMPYSPEEWMWMKFDKEGTRIAVEGDETYQRDIKEIGKGLLPD